MGKEVVEVVTVEEPPKVESLPVEVTPEEEPPAVVEETKVAEAPKEEIVVEAVEEVKEVVEEVKEVVEAVTIEEPPKVDSLPVEVPPEVEPAAVVEETKITEAPEEATTTA